MPWSPLCSGGVSALVLTPFANSFAVHQSCLTCLSLFAAYNINVMLVFGCTAELPVLLSTAAGLHTFAAKTAHALWAFCSSLCAQCSAMLALGRCMVTKQRLKQPTAHMQVVEQRLSVFQKLGFCTRVYMLTVLGDFDATV